jgi:hypothetical protein
MQLPLESAIGRRSASLLLTILAARVVLCPGGNANIEIVS